MTAFLSFKNKKVGIMGLGLTGRATYIAVKDMAELFCYDDSQKNRENFATEFGTLPLRALSDPIWTKLDKIVVSPGVPWSHLVFKIAAACNISIISDIDILFEECRTSQFISITGTNGKSTTTALISHILKNNNYNYEMGGNIGMPALALPLNKKGYVLELSSFQLDLIKTFTNDIAVLLNITPDHLDRYENFEAYIKSKEKILTSLKNEGVGIIGIDNEITKKIYNNYISTNLKGIKLIPISSSDIPLQGVSVLPGKIYDNIFESLIFNLPNNKSLQGAHNRENIAASYAACRILGIEPQKIIEELPSFAGLPHRMQYIGGIKNIYFYNDSKATNAEAASKSISALDNIYWLAGGIAKTGGIDELKPLFKRIKKAYLFGRDKELFYSTLKNNVEVKLCTNLEEAFILAYNDALEDESGLKNLLLAPACASYDQFLNFEHRGNEFIKLCKAKIEEAF